MRKCLSIFFALAALSLNAQTDIPEIYCKVDPQNVSVTEGGIYVIINKEIIQAKNLEWFDDGLYCKTEDLNLVKLNWRCQACGYINYFYNSTCQNPACPKYKKAP